MPDQTPLTLYDQGYDRPHFADRDPQEILAAIVAEMEQLLERTLYPAQIERLLSNLQAYREVGVRQAIQYTGEQNLVAFADGVNLDYLGELLGVYRLGESAAACTLRFTLSQAPTFSVVIPKGLRAARGRGAGQVHWVTQSAALVRGTNEGGPANLNSEGKPYVDIPAIADTLGIIGNGFQAGEVNVLVSDPPQWFESVVNLDMTQQGGPVESDDRLRRRLILAPERFSGGSGGAYKFMALSVSPHIADVAVVQMEPGHLVVSPLTRDGLPGSTLLQEVYAALAPDSRRPVTDWVTVAAPMEIPLVLDVTVTPFKGRNVAEVKNRVRNGLNTWTAERNPSLGIDFVPSQVCAAIAGLPGVYRVEVNSPEYQVVKPNEWAHYTDAIIRMAEPQEG